MVEYYLTIFSKTNKYPSLDKNIFYVPQNERFFAWII